MATISKQTIKKKRKIEKIDIYEYPQDYTPVINHDKFGNTYINKPPLNVVLMDKINEIVDRLNNI